MYYQQNQCGSSVLMTAGGSNDSSVLGGWYGVRLQLLMAPHITEGRVKNGDLGRGLLLAEKTGDCLYGQKRQGVLRRISGKLPNTVQ